MPLFSIATVSVSGSFREKLVALAAAGFQGIEIFEQDFLASDRDPGEGGRMVRDHGLEIAPLQQFRDFEVMNALGNSMMPVCTSLHPEARGGRVPAARHITHRDIGYSNFLLMR